MNEHIIKVTKNEGKLESCTTVYLKIIMQVRSTVL